MAVGYGWKFEDILQQIGEFGPYQLRIFVLLTLMDLSIAQCMLFHVYGNLAPEWTCVMWNGTKTSWNGTNTSWEKTCERDGLYCEQFTFYGPVKSIISEWSLICDRNYVGALSISLFFVGVLIGAGVGGQIADSFGRKKILMVCASLQMLTQVLLGFVDHWQLYCVLRMAVGCFVGTNLLLCFSLPIEFIGAKWRSLCGAVGIFGLGLCFLTLWSYFFPNWRHQAFLSGGVCFPLLIAIYFWVPESVRWLIQRGQLVDAEYILVTIAKFNKRPEPDCRCLNKIALLDEQTQSQQKRYTYLDLFKDRQMGRQTLILMIVWINGSMLYYGISAQLGDLAGNVYLNSVIASLTSMPVSWTIVWSANRFGRKRAYTLYNLAPCVGMVLILVLAAVLPEDDPTVRASITVLILLSLSGANAAWSIGCMYTGELYATLIRNTSTGICSMAARISGILAPQVLFLGTFTHWTLPYVIYAVLALSSAVLVLIYLPETNGHPLPEYVPGIPEKKLQARDRNDEEKLDLSATIDDAL